MFQSLSSESGDVCGLTPVSAPGRIASVVLAQRAKTDSLDARVLAKFGQVVTPPCLTIPSGPQAELKQLVERRRQLIELRTAETNRQQQLSVKHALRSVAAVLKLLEKEVRQTETQIARLIADHDDWRQRDKIIQSHPGLANVASRAPGRSWLNLRRNRTSVSERRCGRALGTLRRRVPNRVA